MGKRGRPLKAKQYTALEALAFLAGPQPFAYLLAWAGLDGKGAGFWGVAKLKMGPKARTLAELKKHILTHRRIIPSGCWEWTEGKAYRHYPYGITCYKSKRLLVHRAAAIFWLGLRPNSKLNVLHKCDNPPCFNPRHLFLGTQRDNTLDAMKKGRIKFGRGEKIGNSKLKPRDVIFILKNRCKIHSSILAKRFGVSRSALTYIWRGKTWKHLRPKNYRPIPHQRLNHKLGAQVKTLDWSVILKKSWATRRKLYGRIGMKPNSPQKRRRGMDNLKRRENRCR